MKTLMAFWLLSLAACASNPRFPFDRQGWLGSDDAYSVELSPGRTLFLFGDTFYQDLQNPVDGFVPRSFNRITSNTIGISTSNGMKYHFGKRSEDHVDPFFVHPDYHSKGIRFWPKDAFMHDGELYVSLLEVSVTPAGGIAQFGTMLAKISNPQDDASKWKQELINMSESEKIIPGTSFVMNGKHLFSFATLQDKSHPNQPIVLLRTEFPSLKWEYLSEDGSWTASDLKTIPSDIKLVMPSGSTEMSVKYHPTVKKWIALYSGVAYLTNTMHVRSADSLEGPWSMPETIHTYKEMLPGEKNVKEAFCYAGKEHVQYASDEKLIYTYVCNSNDLNEILNNPDIYVPQVRSLNLNEILAERNLSK